MIAEFLQRLRPPHIHHFRYVKTGIDFTYSDEEVHAMPLEIQPVAAFAGPMVDVYQCRCGERQLRRVYR